MPMPHLLNLLGPQPYLTIEDEGGAGGGGGGGTDDGSRDEAGGGGEGQGNGHEGPVTMEALRALFDERDKRDAGYRKKINDELARLRRGGRSSETDDGADGGNKRDDKPSYLTRDDLDADRRFSRALGRLEAADIDSEELAAIEEETSEMTPAERARYVEAIARGMGLNSSKPQATRDRDGRRRVNAGDGGKPPPPPKPSNHPETFEEYRQIAKSDPKRKAELDADPTFSAVELRERDRQRAQDRYVASRRA